MESTISAGQLLLMGTMSSVFASSAANLGRCGDALPNVCGSLDVVDIADAVHSGVNIPAGGVVPVHAVSNSLLILLYTLSLFLLFRL